jgi:pyrroloquinoline-quinone synthase
MRRRVEALRSDLLDVMDRKDHWAWCHFDEGRATRPQLLEHYRQEFEVYVRDFPVFLSRVHARCPHPDVRRDLAENLYEEETGKLSLGVPHPELFLRMMEGLGFPRKGFERVALLPKGRRYRAWIDQVTTRRPWIEGAALVTIFIEGSVEDRRRIVAAKPEGPADVERAIRETALVRHYGVDPGFLDLKRAHHMVETGHRKMAWRMVLDHVASPGAADRLRQVLARTLALWLSYRDDVARACGIDPPSVAGRIARPGKASLRRSRRRT